MNSTHQNATMYTRLRAQEMANSTKPYTSKGKKLKRCETCQMAIAACMCPWRPSAQCHVDFVVLMHRLELFKPTNTGRLIAEVFPATQVYLWSRTQPQSALFALLKDTSRACFLVFPYQVTAERPRTVINSIPPNILKSASNNPEKSTEKKYKKCTFILLDGSWRQCSRMAMLSRWLDAVPCLSLPESFVKNYVLRDSQCSNRFSTVEAAISCLHLAEDMTAANLLHHYFSVFNEHYLATRGNYAPTKSDSHIFLEKVKNRN